METVKKEVVFKVGDKVIGHLDYHRWSPEMGEFIPTIESKVALINHNDVIYLSGSNYPFLYCELELSTQKKKADEIPKDWHYKATESNIKDCKAWLDAKGGKFNGNRSSKLIKVGYYLLSKHENDGSYIWGRPDIKCESYYDSYTALTDAQFKLVLGRDVLEPPPTIEQFEGYVVYNGVTKEQLTRENTAFHCKTEEEARLLLDTAHRLDLKWNSGDACNKETHWEPGLSYNFVPGACHASTCWYLDNGYHIIEVSDLIPIVGGTWVKGWTTCPGIQNSGLGKQVIDNYIIEEAPLRQYLTTPTEATYKRKRAVLHPRKEVKNRLNNK